MKSMPNLESLYCRSKTRGGEAVVLLLLGDHEPPLEVWGGMPRFQGYTFSPVAGET
jgi:hypothetical protein